VRRYTAADRASVQTTLVERFAGDERVEGVLVVGSGAEGFADEYSDLDLAVVLGRGEPAAFAREWAERLEHELPVVHRFGGDRGDAGYVVGLLLENFLKVDIGFLRMDQMADRGMPWAREVRDRVEESLPRSLEPRELARGLAAAAEAFFTEASALEAELDLDIAARLEPVILEYFDDFERIG
jgi:predicted nucleotidyltransferase